MSKRKHRKTIFTKKKTKSQPKKDEETKDEKDKKPLPKSYGSDVYETRGGETGGTTAGMWGGHPAPGPRGKGKKK